jgi:hypothetical protein
MAVAGRTLLLWWFLDIDVGTLCFLTLTLPAFF